ncbi:MAG: hypothetical protein ABEH78_09415 [Haloferacaceae archaeon]
MTIDQEIKPGQVYREPDDDSAFKIMDVSEVMEQAKVLYIDDIDGEEVVDTRKRAEFKPLEVIRRRLAEGSLVRVGTDHHGGVE